MTAPTAERLMRSRFSAFAVGAVPYLLASWHPSTRPATLTLETDLEWLALDVLGATAGGEGDQAGTVQFVAHFRDRTTGERGQQAENSVFLRESGHWFYVRSLD